MINSARNNLITNTNASLPNMSETIKSWFLTITFEIVKRDVGDSADPVVTVEKTITTKGVVQPPRDIDLKILPEGSWAWEWLMLHCLPDVELNTNQFVRYDNKIYKVMAKKDWQKYGYVRYMLLEAFQAENL